MEERLLEKDRELEEQKMKVREKQIELDVSKLMHKEMLEQMIKAVVKEEVKSAMQEESKVEIEIPLTQAETVASTQPTKALLQQLQEFTQQDTEQSLVASSQHSVDGNLESTIRQDEVVGDTPDRSYESEGGEPVRFFQPGRSQNDRQEGLSLQELLQDNSRHIGMQQSQVARQRAPKERNPIRFVEGSEIVYELSGKKMVKMGYWAAQGIFLVHIRDYKGGRGAIHYPDPKGIALTLDVWETLFANVEDMNQDVQELARNHGIGQQQVGNRFDSYQYGRQGDSFSTASRINASINDASRSVF
ncbi:hypothetical protein FGO68_gene2212 [Halteria grandinella]|uniref:Uncharacterized protein n=1 Tax=Halteria grandinella TaxID=5974 RepID=A0A8J8NY24_HALGN|nr:hypothetical protein FGO68_gene2212 [Halteria grandinella]